MKSKSPILSAVDRIKEEVEARISRQRKEKSNSLPSPPLSLATCCLALSVWCGPPPNPFNSAADSTSSLFQREGRKVGPSGLPALLPFAFPLPGFCMLTPPLLLWVTRDRREKIRNFSSFLQSTIFSRAGWKGKGKDSERGRRRRRQQIYLFCPANEKQRKKERRRRASFFCFEGGGQGQGRRRKEGRPGCARGCKLVLLVSTFLILQPTFPPVSDFLPLSLPSLLLLNKPHWVQIT